MRLIAAVLVLQAASLTADSPAPLRWQRMIFTAGARGPVCAVLDTNVLAHTAARSADDLQVYRASPGGETKVPSSLIESETDPEDAATAVVRRAGIRRGALDFDLQMPDRPYSALVLKIAATDFVGRAVVTGGGKELGSFPVFDLSADGLSRSTTLALAETALPELHISLRMSGLHGRSLRISASMIQGAEVPVSREAQTLYTVVASSRQVRQMSGSQRAELLVPAHVPVERVDFVLDPHDQKEFQRRVLAGGALPGRAHTGAAVETVQGSIWRVRRQSGIEAELLHMDAVLGLSLHDPAHVIVAVDNTADGRPLPPLPIREVRLEMRQRSVCFNAVPDTQYWLRYGDADTAHRVSLWAANISRTLHTENIDSQKFTAGTAMAALGPEALNAEFHPRPQASKGQEEWLWIAAISIVIAVGAALGSVLRRRSAPAP